MTSMTKHSYRAVLLRPGRRLTGRTGVPTIAKGMREWAENPPPEIAAKVSALLFTFLLPG